MIRNLCSIFSWQVHVRLLDISCPLISSHRREREAALSSTIPKYGNIALISMSCVTSKSVETVNLCLQVVPRIVNIAVQHKEAEALSKLALVSNAGPTLALLLLTPTIVVTSVSRWPCSVFLTVCQTRVVHQDPNTPQNGHRFRGEATLPQSTTRDPRTSLRPYLPPRSQSPTRGG